MKKITAILLLSFITTVTLAQDATVTITRKKLYTGQNGPLKVFIDGKLVCQVNDNAYTVQSLPEGKHKVAVQYSGKTLKDNAETFELDAKPGAAYFLKASKEGIKQKLVLEEVTHSTWEKLKEDLQQDDCL